MRRTIFTLALLASLFSGLLAPVASACPSCKDSVATGASENSGVGEANAGLSSGFNTSIYFLLTSFVGVLGFVGYTLYRGVRGTPDTHNS